MLDSQTQGALNRAEYVWANIDLILSTVSMRYLNKFLRTPKKTSFTVYHTNILAYEKAIDVCGSRVKDVVAFMPFGPNSGERMN